jgi:HK97 family phage prohead protease
VRDDPRGLFYRVQINHDDPLAVAVWAQVAHGDLVGSSFAFDVDAIDEEWHAPRGRGILPLRILWRVKLIDVAPVTRPAYSQTTIQARHAPVRSVVRVLHLGTRGR